MLPQIFPLLSAAPGVTAILGSPPDMRAYLHGRAPQNVATPYLTYQVVGGAPENCLTDPPPCDSFGVRVDCWADSGADCEALAVAVRAALQTSAHCTGYPVDERDPITNRYRLSMQFDFWVLR
jgi:hypothetical protein